MPEKEAPAETVIVHDIIAMLEYYQALGIERIPFAFRAKISPSHSKDDNALPKAFGTLPSSATPPPPASPSLAKRGLGGVPDSRRGKGELSASPSVVNSSNVAEAQSPYIAQPAPGDKAKLLADLRDEIGDCRRCKLSVRRKNIVFGEGNPDARLMFVGEGPGEEEDIQGRPFVGKAGILLDRLIEKMELRRDEVYIANIVKCRPPENREPEKDEVASCRGFVERQIDIISPGVIMTLGKVALQTLMNDYTLKITAARGKFLDFRGFSVMPTFHPAYLLRNPSDKWKTWADAQKAIEKLHIRS